MKVCVISFDYWGFDRYIIDELQRRDVKVTHINLVNFKYKHPSLLHRILNTFNKLAFKKNIKKIMRQQYVLDQLDAIGKQDIILTIRPDLLDKQTHLAIKDKTGSYFAYLYDSTKRFGVEHLLDGIFDKMFSFDAEDVARYGFKHISNYIYLPKKVLKPSIRFDYKVFMVVSGDERLQTLNAIARRFDELGVTYKFIVRASRRPGGLNPNIEYSKDDIGQEQLMEYLDKAEIFLDIIRHGHNGLSFRIFEALAYQKKLITTNASVKNYDFYNPNNIMVVDPDNIAIDAAFFETPYQQVNERIYNKYTIEKWVTHVFFE